jgi:hypothetical protein
MGKYMSYEESYKIKPNLYFHLKIDNGELTAETRVKFNILNFIPYLLSNTKKFYVLEIDNGAESVKDYIEISLTRELKEKELFTCDCHDPSHFLIINKHEFEDEIYIEFVIPVAPLPIKERFKQFFNTVFSIDKQNNYHYHTLIHYYNIENGQE